MKFFSLNVSVYSINPTFYASDHTPSPEGDILEGFYCIVKIF